MTDNRAIVALDVGHVRIGVAVASTTARLAKPLTTIKHTLDVIQQIQKIVTTQQAETVVVGLPRGLDGQDTAQTSYTRDFAAHLADQLQVPVVLQDEAGTSVAAEEELRRKNKPYRKENIDSLAATYILEDYLGTLEDPA